MVIYGFGGILSRAISFLLLPIYTRFLSTAEYGTLDTLTVISSLLGAITVMGLDEYQSINFYKYKKDIKEKRRETISSILQFRLIWGSFCILIATILSPTINALLFQGELDITYFLIAFSSMLFTQLMYQSADIYRLLLRPWSYVFLIFAQSLIGSFLIFYFIIGLNLGVIGFFYGTAISTIVVSFLSWYNLRHYLDFRVLYAKKYYGMIKFGFPLIPVGLIEGANNFLDRLFISFYHGQEQVGIFGIGARFSLILLIFVDTFRKAYWPLFMKKLHTSDVKTFLQNIALIYFNFICIGVILLTFFARFLVETLIGVNFHSGWEIVGPLCWQAVFLGGFVIFAAGIYKTERSNLQFPCILLVVLTNAALNWFLVPLYGNLGAAIATATAFLLWNVLILIVTEIIWRVAFPYFKIIFPIIVSIVHMFWINLIAEGKINLETILVTCFACLLCLANTYLGTYLKKTNKRYSQDVNQ